jgi:hypothetical protein
MSMAHPRVYADFHNADAKGRLRLNCVGTIEDLSRLKIQLREGLVLTIYSDDAENEGHPSELEVEGRVEHSSDEECWVAAIDWSAIQCVPAGTGDLPSTTQSHVP